MVALTLLKLANGHLTRRKEIDTGDRLVSDCDVAADSVHSQSREGAARVEKGAVGSANSEFHLGKLGHNAKEAHLRLGHKHCALHMGALLSELVEHYYFLFLYINNYYKTND